MQVIISDAYKEWVNNGQVYVIGYGYLDEMFFSKIQLLDVFLDVKDESMFIDKINKLNGCFSVIIDMGNMLLAAVDRIRSYPLFFSCKEKILTDKVQNIVDRNTYDADAINDYSTVGYVTGNKTLIKNVYQIEAGNYIVVKNGCVEQKNYYSFRHCDFYKASQQKLINQYDTKVRNTFKRLINSFNDRQVVVPLSGGQDSRLIVFFLKELGYKNVLCFTYGKKDSTEAKIAQQVAEKVGYRWHLIEYTDKLIRKYARSTSRDNFIEYCANYSSVPHLQDWFAVIELKNNKLLADDCIFVPGHTGDFITGGHIPPMFIFNEIVTLDNMAEMIMKKHYCMFKMQNEKQYDYIYQKLVMQLYEALKKNNFTGEEASDIFEWWDWKERQCKYIVNSVRVYEFFGYEWRLPLFDSELMDYWSHIDYKNRFKRCLYYNYVSEKMLLFSDTEAYEEKDIYKHSEHHILTKLEKAFFCRRFRRKISGINTVIMGYFKHPLNWYKITSFPKLMYYWIKYGAQHFHAINIIRYYQILGLDPKRYLPK